MKSLRVFLCLFAVGALMTACQKNNVEELSSLNSKIESELGLLSVEHASIEELNKIFVDNGFEPFTVEDLGLTQAQYEAVLKGETMPQIAQPRAACPSGFSRVEGKSCGGSLTTYWLDVNNDGVLDCFDLGLVRSKILGLPTPGILPIEFSRFGFASATWPTLADGATAPPNPANTQLNGFDIIIALKILNGIYICQ